MGQGTEEILRGAIAAVVYQNNENGYAVLRVESEDGKLVTVVGTVPMAAVGEQLVVAGRWCSHATYGAQFQAEFLERSMPENKHDIVAYLATGLLRGVGDRLAERIVKKFGEQTLSVIESEPERLAEVSGISPRKAEEIGKSFRRQVGLRRLIEFLAQYRLPPELAVKLYHTYGDMAVEMVQENPYILTDPAFGASFSVVDAFAIEMGTPADDPQRVAAGVQFELTHNLGNGHVFLPKNKLLQATMQMLALPQQTVETAMEQLQEDDGLRVRQVASVEACYLPEYEQAETEVAQRIFQMAQTVLTPPRDLEKRIDAIEKACGIDYAPLQREAIRTAASRQLMLLTGGPGTGKTTALRGILALLEELDCKTELAAPTGRAAKRLTELTEREASTIHRLLEAQMDPESGTLSFFHDASEPLKIDALIVDEVSMVDLQLMASLLEALPPDCRLILVGDPDQLPSVGAGNVFSDLIRSERVATVRLTEVFRQAQQSLIVMNAHAVNRGEFPELRVKDRDFFFLPRHTAEQLVQTVVDLCATRLPRIGIPSQEIQVLTPTRKYEVGTVNLNRRLQEALNPPGEGKHEKKYGEYVFREGDRVMQIRNNYDILWKKTDGFGSGTGIFNGDVGIIRTVDLSAETVTVVFEDREAKYGFDMLMELEPAYAMTVHKSQGSEYRAVVLVTWPGTPMLQTRSILYTAITRAREMMILVGEPQVVATMVENNRQQRRYSGLRWRLAEGQA